MRDFDFVMCEHDVLVGLGGLAADLLSGLPTPVVGGLVASQSNVASLTINIGAGRIYQFGQSDATAVGSIPQDTSVIVQQGYAPAQTLTLVPPSAGQSQWNLIQAQFSQVDAVRTNDPNGGIVPFYNAANPTQPNSNSINTVRKAVCIIQVITGSAATTGSEIPPNPTGGWVPLYLVDLAGGQTQITTAQIIPTGPSIGTGVSSTYQVAPFIAGLLASHHNGTAGQAAKIKLGSEVQGVLPYANMSSVRTLLTAPLTLYVNGSTGSDANAGTSPSAPYKTILAAANSMYRQYDFNGFAGTISVANGSYLITSGPNTYGAIFSGQPIGMNTPIQFIGNIASPGSVTIGVTNGNGVLVANGANVSMAGFTVTTTGTSIGLVSTSGYGVVCSTGSALTISNCVIGSCGSVQIQSAFGSLIIVSSSLTLTGNTQYAIVAAFGGTVWTNSATITVTGLTVTVAFAYSTQSGSIEALSNTFIGTAVGPRYSASLNGSIYINSGGTNTTYFPGSTAGSTSSGGQYI